MPSFWFCGNFYTFPPSDSADRVLVGPLRVRHSVLQLLGISLRDSLTQQSPWLPIAKGILMPKLLSQAFQLFYNIADFIVPLILCCPTHTLPWHSGLASDPLCLFLPSFYSAFIIWFMFHFLREAILDLYGHTDHSVSLHKVL